MLRYDPATGEFINDISIYTVRRCGPKWYLMKREYIGYSRKYHKSVYSNHIMGIFDKYEPAILAQRYLTSSSNITTSASSLWSTTYITHFENQTTYNIDTTDQTFPIVTARVPRVLTQAPDEEVAIG